MHNLMNRWNKFYPLAVPTVQANLSGGSRSCATAPGVDAQRPRGSVALHGAGLLKCVMMLAAVSLSFNAHAGDFGAGPTGEKLSGAVLLVLAVACISIGLLAVLFLFGLLRPETVRRGSARVRTSPGRCLLIGVLGLVVCVIAGALLNAIPPAVRALPGLALVLVIAYLTVSGLSMLAHSIGERVQTAVMARSLGSDAMAVLYGGVLLLAIGMLPGLGQLIQLVAIMIGMGSAISTLFSRAEAKPVPPPLPAPPPQ